MNSTQDVKTQTAKQANKADNLLQAAYRAMADKGYAQVSMRDIAVEAGVNKSLLHYYFADKNALVMELFRSLNRDYVELISQVVSTGDSFEDQIIQGYEAFRDFSGKQPKWLLMILDLTIQAVQNPENRNEAKTLHQELVALISNRMKTAKDQGEVKPEADEDVMANIVLAAAIGIGVLYTIDNQATDFSKAYDYLVQMIRCFAIE